MLHQRVTSSNQDAVGGAYYEWREAANAWTSFCGSLKQDTGQVSLEQKKRLRALEMQLKQASDRYIQIRAITNHRRASMA